MKTCIEITTKGGTVYRPMLQFDYDDVQNPLVVETENEILISYYKAEEYWEIRDAWLERIHCKIIGECGGYFSPTHIKNDWDEEIDLPDFFTYDEDGERIGLKLPDGYPEYAVRFLAGRCHSEVYWRETDDPDDVDAVLFVDPEYVKELNDKYGDVAVHDMIVSDITRCHCLLDGDQIYTHNIIKVDKRTGESDLMGMVTYLFYEDCTKEGLMGWVDTYTPCEYKLIPLSEIITTY